MSVQARKVERELDEWGRLTKETITETTHSGKVIKETTTWTYPVVRLHDYVSHEWVTMLTVVEES